MKIDYNDKNRLYPMQKDNSKNQLEKSFLRLDF